MIGVFFSYVLKQRKMDVSYIINGVLGSLVSITGKILVSEYYRTLNIGISPYCTLAVFRVEMYGSYVMCALIQ